MKLKDYLANAQLFPLMGVSQLNAIGEVLDKLLRTQHGMKTCGAIITEFVEPDGKKITGLLCKYSYGKISEPLFKGTSGRCDLYASSVSVGDHFLYEKERNAFAADCGSHDRLYLYSLLGGNLL